MSWPGRILVAVALLATSARAEEPPNLYDWVGVAPIVVVGTTISDAGRLVEFHAERALRGEVEPDSVLRVDLREANRARSYELHPRALHLEPGRSFVLLLKPDPGRQGKGTPVYTLVRGVLGAYELPPEGSARVLAALERFIEIQDENDDRLVWQRMGQLLGEGDPLVVRTALGQFLKFHRGNAEHLEPARRLIDHGDEGIRERALDLTAQLLRRDAMDAELDLAGLEAQLVARARRDSSVAVRVAAAHALAALDGPGTDRILEEISRDDPDQAVRYVAERILYERRRARSAAPRESAARPD